MPAAPRTDLKAFPNSRYAAELQQGARNRYADPQLEAEYAETRLLDSRTVIRVATLLTVLVIVLRGMEQALGDPWNPALSIHISIVLGTSIMIAVLAWSPWFARFYLPVAQIGIPIRNAFIAVLAAGAAAHAHSEMLLLLPLLVLGPFFFLGLPFGVACASAVLTTVSYGMSALAFDLQTPLAVRTCAFLAITAGACAVAAWQLEKHWRASFLEKRLLAELAELDPLTGMKNRRMLDEHLARIWQQTNDDVRMIAVLLIDVDHFKAYNDRYGHQAGDEVLRRVAHELRSFTQHPLDILARYGGEEFAALLYDADTVQARAIAERMRRSVSDLAIEHHGSDICAAVTVSVGVAAVLPNRRREFRGVIQLADEALYKAKLQGRNRVELLDQAEYDGLITGIFAQNGIAAGR